MFLGIQVALQVRVRDGYSSVEAPINQLPAARPGSAICV